MSTTTEKKRFTAWFSQRELDGLRNLADEHETSVNYMVRLAVRRMLRFSAPAEDEEPAQQ